MLRLVPVHLAEANAFVARVHRHSAPVLGARFSIAIADERDVRGVAIVGRPIARRLNDGWTVEVNRLATDGVRNGCSMLYGAAWRAARAIGYARIVTYTLDAEGGASLRAAGWSRVADLAATEGWSRESRPRDNDLYLSARRVRWQKGESPGGAPPCIETEEAHDGQGSLLDYSTEGT